MAVNTVYLAFIWSLIVLISANDGTISYNSPEVCGDNTYRKEIPVCRSDHEERILNVNLDCNQTMVSVTFNDPDLDVNDISRREVRLSCSGLDNDQSVTNCSGTRTASGADYNDKVIFYNLTGAGIHPGSTCTISGCFKEDGGPYFRAQTETCTLPTVPTTTAQQTTMPTTTMATTTFTSDPVTSGSTNSSHATAVSAAAGVPIAAIITVPTILLVLIFIATLIIVIIVIKIRKKENEYYYSEVGPPPLPMRMERNTSHQQGLQTFQVLNVGDHGQNPAAHIATTLVDENSLKTKQATTTSENPAYGATKVSVTTAENTAYQANELDVTLTENTGYGATDVAVTTSENPAYGATDVAVTSENPVYVTNFTDLSNGKDTET